MKPILMIPILALGTAFADSHQSPTSTSGTKAHASVQAQHSPQMSFVLQRKERIQNVLIALDQVAEITAQMKPETADRIEPVIVDLAEQTIDLANERALQSDETDAALGKIEATVTELIRTMNRYVEPEASL